METINDILSNKAINKKNSNGSSLCNLMENINNISIEKILNIPTKKFTYDNKDNQNLILLKSKIQQNNDEIISKNLESNLENKEKILTNNNCVFKLNLLDYKNNYNNNSRQYKSIQVNQNEIDYIKNFIKMDSTEKISLLSSPLNKNIWFRGKIKKIKLLNNEIYQYFNDNYEIILMSAIKKNRKSFKIFSEEQFLKKIGSIKVNILGNKYKIKMEKNIQNKCKVKYV
jgi:hypothetical protein